MEKKVSEEKKLILEMLSAGKINVDEAEKLLDSTEEEAASPPSNNKKFFKIWVQEENKTKVNINIPIALAEVGLKLVPKDKFNLKGNEINFDEMLKLIKEGNVGELVNIDTIDHGKEVKVKILIE